MVNQVVHCWPPFRKLPGGSVR